MSGSHAPSEGLYVPGSSTLHRAPAECKLVATVLFVIVMVTTPREAWWAFLAQAAIVAVAAALGRVPAGHLLRRLVIELPFVAFAVLLPVVGRGERVDVLGVSLSVAGLWAAWNIVVKATLGVAATVVLASTTPVTDLLAAMRRLHVPAVFVGICGFMIRYADVVSGELHRMRVARVSRGDDPRWLWQARGVAATAGALFVRSYERGERVYLAMVSRGYDGAMPALDARRATPRQWALAAIAPAAAAVVSLVAWSVR